MNTNTSKQVDKILWEAFSNGRDELTSDFRVEQYRNALTAIIENTQAQLLRELISCASTLHELGLSYGDNSEVISLEDVKLKLSQLESKL
jgi:hypothetical protein